MSKKKAPAQESAGNLEPLLEASEEPTIAVEPAEPVVEPVVEAADPYAAAIQDVLGDPEYDHRGAHHTEHLAIRKLVDRGHNEATATAEVRRRLY